MVPDPRPPLCRRRPQLGGYRLVLPSCGTAPGAEVWRFSSGIRNWIAKVRQGTGCRLDRTSERWRQARVTVPIVMAGVTSLAETAAPDVAQVLTDAFLDDPGW